MSASPDRRKAVAARPNNLALLNLAAGCVAPDETYVEVGAFRSASLIGALLDNDGVEFLAIDDFSHEGASRDELERNLARFGLDGRVAILEGDAFELLPGGRPRRAPCRRLLLRRGAHLRAAAQWVAAR